MLTQEGCFPSVWRDGRRHEVSKGKLGIGASEKHLSPEEAPTCHGIRGDSSGGCYGFHLKCLTRLMFSAGGPTLWPCFGGCGACRRGIWLEEEERRAVFSCHFSEVSPPGPSYSALCHIVLMILSQPSIPSWPTWIVTRHTVSHRNFSSLSCFCQLSGHTNAKVMTVVTQMQK